MQIFPLVFFFYFSIFGLACFDWNGFNLVFSDKEQVWVNCKGEYPADIEALGKPVYYPDTRGFPGYYFPYMKQENYQSPIVAVQFPDAEVNQLLHVECRVWAKNIKYNKRDRIGLNHFELHILDQNAAEEIAKN